MDLETFIAETLRQIVKGVEAAQKHSDCERAVINSTDTVGAIDFDIAVTVSQESEKQGKGNIGVASIFGIGGQVNSTAANSSVNSAQHLPITVICWRRPAKIKKSSLRVADWVLSRGGAWI